MKMNKLGRTDLNVSEICLGTMTWGEQNSEADAHEQIDYALDQGINFMDTAELYAVPPKPETYGKTEEHIGTWFQKNGKRDQWILATKVAGAGVKWVRDGKPISKQTITEAVEGSLKRLQTDYIDLYQLHWPNRGTYHFENSWTFDAGKQPTQSTLDNMLEVLQTLDGLVKAGKIRHFGLSNESGWGIMQYLKIAEAHNLPRPVSTQNEYSLLRRLFDLDLSEVARHEDVGLLAYSPLAAGALSGKYLDGAVPAGSRAAISNGIYRHNEFSEPAIRCYVNLAQDHGLDPCQMAIAFCLTRFFMTSVIIGATKMDQLKSDIAAANVTLNEDVLQGIQEIYHRYPRTV